MSTTEEFQEEMCTWAAAVVAGGAMLLHKEYLVVGKATGWYDGKVRRKDDCTAPVIEFDNGHSFIANPVHFVRLGHAEAAFFALVSNDISALVHRTAAVAALGQVPPKASFDLMLAALSSAERALKRAQEPR